MSDRVRIGTCANPADAALVRSVFAAFGLDVLIAAEHHASLLGGVGSNFLSLDIWVDAADADEASALLRDLRENGAHDTGESDADGAGSGDDPEAAGPDADGLDDVCAPDEVRLRTLRRRRAGVAMLLGCCVTFGSAHMVTGAWKRGFALAMLEIFGFLQIMHGGTLGSLPVIAAIVADLIGAFALIRDAHQPTIPTARLRLTGRRRG